MGADRTVSDGNGRVGTVRAAGATGKLLDAGDRTVGDRNGLAVSENGSKSDASKASFDPAG
jgi:hypothetical protein